MSIESIEKGVEREENIASEELASGLIDVSEYNRRIREIEREAREYAREEAGQAYADYFHN